MSMTKEFEQEYFKPMQSLSELKSLQAFTVLDPKDLPFALDTLFLIKKKVYEITERLDIVVDFKESYEYKMRAIDNTIAWFRVSQDHLNKVATHLATKERYSRVRMKAFVKI